MVIAAGAFIIALILVLACLSLTVKGWTRGLTTNFAATSDGDQEPRLHPIVSPEPALKLAEVVAAAAQKIAGWELISREETDQETTLRLVRTTRLLGFKDDITVHIRPLKDPPEPPSHEISAESQSRVGKGDFGQNRRNLVELMDMIRALLR